MKHVLVLVVTVVILVGMVSMAEAYPSQPGPALDWYLQEVDQFDQFGPITNRSLKIDSAGHPHVVYAARNTLYHAWNDGVIWHSEIVDNIASLSYPAMYPCLALDSADRPHVVYINEGDLEYAYWTGVTWSVQLVEAGVGGTASLALDAADQPHISYYLNDYDGNADTYTVKYASWTGDGWFIRVIEQGINLHSNITTLGTSVALDSAGIPHVSYALSYLNDPCYYCIKYASWTGSAWDIQIVEEGQSAIVPTSVYSPDLVFDANDVPHLLYGRRVGSVIYTDYLLYASLKENTWEIQTINSSPMTDLESLAFDSNGGPHILADTGNMLEHVYWTGTTWSTQPIAGEYARFGSLALDAYDRASAVYYNEVSGSLKYAQQLPALTLTNQAFPKDGVSIGETLTYTLSFSGAAGHDVILWDPLPRGVLYVPGSVTYPAVYSSTVQAVLWQGALPAEPASPISFQVTLTDTLELPLYGGSSRDGSPQMPAIVNTAWLTDTGYSKEVSARAIVNGWYVYLPLTMR